MDFAGVRMGFGSLNAITQSATINAPTTPNCIGVAMNGVCL